MLPNLKEEKNIIMKYYHETNNLLESNSGSDDKSSMIMSYLGENLLYVLNKYMAQVTA